nr:ParA family protein [Micromonospora sp. DSM 115978]
MNTVVAPRGGRLSLVASHLSLGDVEMDLAARLGGAQASKSTKHYFDVYQRLRTGLASLPPDAYDLVLIDCPPNFGVVTRSAIAASDHLLVPARPDSLSTLGIDHLLSRLRRFSWEFNKVADLQAETYPGVNKLQPHVLGIVLTMVQYYRGNPISAMASHILHVKNLDVGVPVFDTMVRE